MFKAFELIPSKRHAKKQKESVSSRPVRRIVSIFDRDKAVTYSQRVSSHLAETLSEKASLLYPSPSHSMCMIDCSKKTTVFQHCDWRFRGNGARDDASAQPSIPFRGHVETLAPFSHLSPADVASVCFDTTGPSRRGKRNVERKPIASWLPIKLIGGVSAAAVHCSPFSGLTFAFPLEGMLDRDSAQRCRENRSLKMFRDFSTLQKIKAAFNL